MLIKAKTLKGFKLNSLDGEIGAVQEFLFDDLHWTVRYLVADTGSWLVERQVLISPHAVDSVNVEEKNIIVELTQKQIEESPSLDSDKPVSRQYEEEYFGFYGWPAYWDGPYRWGPYPGLSRMGQKGVRQNPNGKAWDPHLRSTHDVNGHYIQATDGEIGHVEDFIIDDETWAIRYLVVDTKNYGLGKLALVSPQWIEKVDWSQKKVVLGLTREAIRQSPEYSADSLLTREFETDLHRHYNRHGYWIDELAAQEGSR